mgnify:CR=1 FL=1
MGLLWLLNSIGTIIDLDLPVLFRLWPLLLIFVGLDFLIGRRNRFIGAILGGLAIAVIVGFSLGGRALGLSPDVQIKTERFQVPIEHAQSGKIELVLTDNPVTIQALSESSNLLDAELTYVGTIYFRTSGASRKTVLLARNEADFLLFSPLYWDPSLDWRIGISPRIPVDIALDGSSGSSQIDLSQLRVNSIKAEMGSGESHWIAPGVLQPATFTLESGSGSVDLQIQNGTQLTLTLSSGSGAVQVRLPAQAAARVDVRHRGSGSIHFPQTWLQTSPEGKTRGEESWASPTYTQGERKVEITIKNAGSGSLTFTTE